jgi:pyridoxine 4-dehydrogenase
MALIQSKTGQFKSFDDLPHDHTRHMPRFQPDVFDENLKLVHEVKKIADQKGVTPAQIALGWVLAHSRRNGLGEIIPIPGATTSERIKENMQPAELNEDDMAALGDILKRFTVKGDRYGGPAARFSEG